MNFHKNRLIHWIAAFAIAISIMAPAVSQAVSLAKHSQGFAMEICVTDGSKATMNIQMHEKEVASSRNIAPIVSPITP
ncbi:DUF2946 family protein [Polynucleobacter necessarius]|uniref:DUF2946 family protein n=1 Tax=Polynucleobacter necessarius TaxID=576610 RepID=UPI0018D537A0|nr:DUF2946 family protein [Polynucleobacter necessarius]